MNWFRSLSLREQRLILVMLALAGIVFAWLLVVRPLGDALADARARHGAAVVALADARARAAEIARLEQQGSAAPGGPADVVVSRSAVEAGFQLSQIQAAPDGSVTLAMDSARPQAFFDWVARLEGAQGLVVERLNARANGDRTIAVELRLRPRRG